jgi:hypothetical protein
MRATEGTEKVASGPAPILGNMRFFCAEQALASAPEREGCGGVIGSAGRGGIAWSPGQLTTGTPPLKAALQSGVPPSVVVGGVTVPRSAGGSVEAPASADRLVGSV